LRSSSGAICGRALRSCWLFVIAHLVFLQPLFFLERDFLITLQLLAMDVSAQVTMKDAAKCDKRCEWQNSANQENVERILHF
jgi:hypothetical protein